MSELDGEELAALELDFGVTAQPMTEGAPVWSSRALGHDPYGLTERYCGGTMRARPGIDDDAEPPSFFRQTEDD